LSGCSHPLVALPTRSPRQGCLDRSTTRRDSRRLHSEAKALDLPARRAADSPARTPGRTSRVRSRRAGHSPRTSLAKEAEAAGPPLATEGRPGERAETRSAPNFVHRSWETSQRSQRRSDWMVAWLHPRSQRPASGRSGAWRLPRGSSLRPLKSYVRRLREVHRGRSDSRLLAGGKGRGRRRAGRIAGGLRRRRLCNRNGPNNQANLTMRGTAL
jgi:hypothetical protein